MITKAQQSQSKTVVNRQGNNVDLLDQIQTGSLWHIKLRINLLPIVIDSTLNNIWVPYLACTLMSTISQHEVKLQLLTYFKKMSLHEFEAKGLHCPTIRPAIGED